MFCNPFIAGLSRREWVISGDAVLFLLQLQYVSNYRYNTFLLFICFMGRCNVLVNHLFEIFFYLILTHPTLGRIHIKINSRFSVFVYSILSCQPQLSHLYNPFLHYQAKLGVWLQNSYISRAKSTL